MTTPAGSTAFLAPQPGSLVLHQAPLRPGQPAAQLLDLEPVAASSFRTALAACIVGLGAGLAGFEGSRRSSRRHAKGAIICRAGKEGSESAIAVTQRSADDVETSVAEFVPKISALQNQAELLRSGELRQVIDTMRSLRKNELGGVFSEVDELLGCLIDAIHSLRDSALTIRQTELRDHFEELDRVGAVSGVPEEDLGGSRGGMSDHDGVETMMEVHVIGLSHHSAPVEVRQKLAVAEADWNKYAQDLVEFARTSNGYVVPEAAVISTCNRFELYFASPELKKYSAIECVHAFLRQQSSLSREEIEPYLFTHTGHAAINHLFEVSSGLDSLVLGEAQILSQVKACHHHCIEKPDPDDKDTVPGSGGKIVAKMLNAGIRIGKLVRTRTKIGKGSVSVSSAAVELMMSRSMADLRKPSGKVQVCIVGAGKMSRLLLLALFSKHPEISVVLVNRSVDKAQAVLDDDLVKARGGQNATVAGMDEMSEVMKRSDVVFTATGSKDPIIHPSDVEGRERNLMLVDISVPLNVAPGCEDVDGVNSYSVDDLKKVVQANAQKRQSEVLKAKKIIAEEVGKFQVWQASQGAVPYLAALQAMAENIRTTETEKMSKKLKGLHEKERAAVDKLTKHIVDQLFRPIYYSMKEDEGVDIKKDKIWALKNMFQLEPLYKRGVLTDGSGAPRGHLNP